MKMINGFMCLLLIQCLCFLCLTVAQTPTQPRQQQPAPQQQPAKEEEETDYTEEDYEAFQKAVNEADLSKREDLIIKFLNDKHKTITLNQYVVAAYLQLYKDYESQKNFQKLTSSAAKFLQQVPRELLKSMDQEAEKAKKQPYAENAYILSLGVAADANKELGNNKKVTEYGEQFYAEKPNGATAYFIAKAYEAQKDTPKFIAWGEKTLQQKPTPEIFLEISLALKNKYVEQHKLDLAAKHARNVLRALDTAKKPPTVSAEEWKKFQDQNKGDIYALLGETAYSRQNLSEAITNFENALRFDKCKDGIYYRLGFAHWKKQPPDVERAMLDFAKSERLNGRTSEEAKKQLDHLYRNLHNNTLVGIDKLYRKVDQDLRGCKSENAKR